MLIKKILLGVSVIVYLVACNTLPIQKVPAESSQTKLIITDSLNREVILEYYPERIVITGLQTPMLIDFFYLFPGAGAKLLAVENRVQTTKEFINLLDTNIAEKMILEKGAGAEQIAPLKPDMILMKDIMRDTVGIKLEELGFSVVYLNFETIDRIKKDIRILGEILNSRTRANELVARIEKEAENISKQVTSLDSKPTVLLLQYSAQGGEEVFKVPPAHWLQTVMIEEAGGIPVWKELDGSAGWNIVTIDQIAAWNAEFLFLVDYSGDPREDVGNLIKKPVWNSLNPTKLYQFFPFPKDHLSWDQPDPRWILGFSWLAEKLHPELKDIYDEENALNDFFAFYYGLSEKVISEKLFQLPLWINNMHARGFWKYSTGIVAVIVVTSIFIGRYPTPFLMPFQTLVTDPIARQLVLNYRIPRLIGALLIGGGLSIAGVCTQTIFRNPLADSGVLGVSQAAAFGAIVGKLIAPREWILAVSIGFGFAALSLFTVSRLSMSKRNNQAVSTISIIIAGIAVSAVFSSGIGLAKYFADAQNQLPDIVFWLMGGLWQINWKALFVITPIIIICATWLFLYRFRLNALAMPDEVAFSLGIDKRKEINFVLALCVAVIAISVTYCGIISWVGLIVPNITRRLVGVNTMQLIPASALLGGAFLLVCDTISRSMLSGEIPVGILTALAGAIILIYILANGKNLKINL